MAKRTPPGLIGFIFTCFAKISKIAFRSVQGIRGKRSAEAEADAEPHYGYGHLGYAGYGYGLPAGYARFGGHYLGKREAEAEPYYGYGLGYYGRGYYGGYGHRYGYGYGYYG